MSLLVVGSVAFDAIETPFAHVERTLGGAATYFSIAASFLTSVHLVGVVGEDFGAEHEAVFHGRDVDLAGLERAKGKTFFWSGRYHDNFNERTTLATDLNVFADFSPKIPASFRKSSFVFLANINPTLQRSVLHQVERKPKLVALDTMNYWITSTPAELKETLRHTDVLMINDSETRQLTDEHNLLRAAKKIFKMGPRTLVIKRGEHGAMMVHNDWVFCVPAYPLDEVHDPTGAGDTFAGGFMGYLTSKGRINEQTLRSAMVYGSVLASFTVERFGVERLATVKRGEIVKRAREFARMTTFKL